MNGRKTCIYLLLASLFLPGMCGNTAHQPRTTPKGCPIGYELYGSLCYRSLDQHLKYSEARENCRIFYGFVAEPRSAEEYIQLSAFAVRYKYVNLWVGATDSEQEGHFQWDSDKSKMDNAVWNKNEPNNYDGIEDCVVFRVAAKNLNDIPCFSHVRHVCQAEPLKNKGPKFTLESTNAIIPKIEEGTTWSILAKLTVAPEDRRNVYQSRVFVNFNTLYTICVSMNLDECPPSQLPSGGTVCYCSGRTDNTYDLNATVVAQVWQSQGNISLKLTHLLPSGTPRVKYVGTLPIIEGMMDHGSDATTAWLRTEYLFHQSLLLFCLIVKNY